MIKDLSKLNWVLVALVLGVTALGIAMQYSAAKGMMFPWAAPQLMRAMFGFVLMILIALMDIRFFFRNAYGLYIFSLILLLITEIKGYVGMGAQRWINLGFFNLQPSELAKITLILVLARYFSEHRVTHKQGLLALIPPVFLMVLPMALVFIEPDLGSALMMVFIGGAMFFCAGVSKKIFISVIMVGLAAAPIGWTFLKDYQKKRVYTFLDPERDPLGAGYHIIQSKIALGSGGILGKGFMNGTQSQLNFLPEKQTDFIFTMIAEELGMIGAMTLLLVYALMIVIMYAISLSSTSTFGLLMGMGLCSHFFFCIFINVAMVMGLLPTKGLPLPLVSYGGTSLLATFMAFGLIQNIHRNKDVLRYS